MTESFSALPAGLLQSLSQIIPEYTLVGAFARDYRVHNVAGLPLVARTLDVDISILVASLADYRERLKQLDGPHGVGIRFVVDGVQVDVIPYGPEVAPGGIVQTADGITLDVTGMAEAAEGADLVEAGGATVRIPALSSMIGLKIVAWNYRGASTQSDSWDLGPLLSATYHGPDGDALWSDGEAGDKWDYDNMLVGPYRAGKQLSGDWREESLHRLRYILGTKLPTLATQVAHHDRSSVDLVVGQLKALREGLDV